jgi:hypothetical protein
VEKLNIMKKNVGAFDGLVRILLAIAIIFYAGLIGPWWLGFIAIVPIATATLSYCPIWDMIGIQTFHEGQAHS